ncbi:hypothetical protein [Nocardia sp. NRRL S-836]|uniref:hypothetical protein n=1 Tax=Nocardia sp. NRRL S-836 TaxID=1519492 RepID=UPI0006AF0994|nr:hypothetical protein [Nocardia sp. NRRL S-836]KOV77998.1 hypothetical protein ADL03_40755 [Nocardia sp. NRRL S-836]
MKVQATQVPTAHERADERCRRAGLAHVVRASQRAGLAEAKRFDVALLPGSRPVERRELTRGGDRSFAALIAVEDPR